MTVSANQKYCVVVDPRATERALPQAFHERRLACVYVRSSIAAPQPAQVAFTGGVTFDGSLDRLVERLRAYPVACVVPNAETGAELADHLAVAFDVATNGTRLSAARTYKPLAYAALARAGLRTPRNVVTSDPEHAVSWAREAGIDACVVKPVASLAGDGVTACATGEQLRTVVTDLLGTNNLLQMVNREVLVEELLRGDEFRVDTVSSSSVHRFTGTWRVRTRTFGGRALVHDDHELLPFDGEVQTALRACVLDVLATLDVAFGAARTEVVMTRDGPTLVELAPAIDPFHNPALERASVGTATVDLVANAYLRPTAFAGQTTIPYTLRRHVRRVFVGALAPGKVTAVPGEQLLGRLATRHSVTWQVEADATVVPPTPCTLTDVALVVLSSTDPSAVDADVSTIRDAESRGEIVTVAHPPAPLAACGDVIVPAVMERLAARDDYRQSERFARLLEQFGWRAARAGDALAFVSRGPERATAEVPRARGVDIDALRTLRDASILDDVFVHPAVQLAVGERALPFAPEDPERFGGCAVYYPPHLRLAP